MANDNPNRPPLPHPQAGPGPIGVCKVKIKNPNNDEFYLTFSSTQNAVGVTREPEVASEVRYGDDRTHVTITLEDRRLVGLLGTSGFAPVPGTTGYQYQWAYTLDGTLYTLHMQGQYWSVTQSQGIMYLSPETDPSKAATVEFIDPESI